MESAYVILGGAGKIGAAVEKKLAESHQNLFILDSSFSGTEEFSPSCFRMEFDAMSDSSFEGFCDLLATRELYIRGLVHLVAHNPPPGELPEPNPYDPQRISVEAFLSELSVNLGTAARMFSFFSRYFRKGTSVVLISSDLGVVAPEPSIYDALGSRVFKSPAYTAAKHGLIGLSRHFAVYLAPKGVRVNAVAPGPVGPIQGQDFEEKVRRRIPLGRLAEAKEVAQAVTFLLSEESSFVTGSTLSVDGGRTTW